MVDLVQLGLLLVFAGFGILVVSVFTQRSKDEGRVQGGGVVMIGPIPIVFGTDMRWASVAIILAIILIVLVLILSVV